MAQVREGDEVLIWDVGMIDAGYDSPILGTVIYVNGDQVDVEDPDGAVDCFPVEWCWIRPPEELDELKLSAGVASG